VEAQGDAPRQCEEAGSGMRLWPSPVPRPVRFHDLRHTTATLLLKSGTPLGVVQRLLGHSDPSITAMTYGHLESEDARAHLDRLSFAPAPAEPVAEVLQLAGERPNGAGTRSAWPTGGPHRRRGPKQRPRLSPVSREESGPSISRGDRI
jgi:integrase